jgi:hypothetical protein
MADTGKVDSGSGGVAKSSPAAIEKTIRSTEADVHAAVHAVLRKAGLHNVKVHSINFSIDAKTLTQPGCQNCDLSANDCVLTPEGFVCRPRS